ncbi:MAG TPA: hypothetical protein VEW26_02890 [Allosphingosinicella sp.]|nr:hypothetical protein [Allosphingosinicella sp.]
MLRFHVMAALAAGLIVAPAASAKEKAEAPREKKVCRTVQMSGRITPERVCRKVERKAPQEQSQRQDRDPAGAADSAESAD